MKKQLATLVLSSFLLTFVSCGPKPGESKDIDHTENIQEAEAAGMSTTDTSSSSTNADTATVPDTTRK